MHPLGQLSDMMDEDHDPDNKTLQTDWAKLKKDQRARILREYWEKLRKRKDLMQKLAKTYKRGRADPHHQQNPINTNPHLLTMFTKPFSAKERDVQEYNHQLKELTKAGLSRLLPWRHILTEQIRHGNTTFTQLTTKKDNRIIPNQKQDTTLKFQFLMDLAHNQEITLTQETTFGQIAISPNTNTQTENTKNITLRDDSGDTCNLDWHDLTPNQRSKVIQDLQDAKVILI